MITAFLGYAQDTTVCHGDYAYYGIHTQTDTANNPSVFEWQIEGGVIQENYGDRVYVNWGSETDTGKLSVTEIGMGGCVGDTIQYVVHFSRPTVDLGFDKAICLGESMEFSTDQEFESYLWPDGSTDETFTMDTAGNVWVKVTNEFGCDASDTAELTVHSLPDVNIEVITDYPDRVFIGDDSLSFIGGEVNTISLDAGVWNWYNWSTGESMSTIDVDASDVASTTGESDTKYYWVTVENEYGCRNSDSMAVTVIRQLKIPNAITPNGDGSNDKWAIPGLSLYPNAVVEVFDRWGDVVFRARGYDEAKYWDGTDQRGRKLPMDSYYYVIKLGTGEKPVFGTITIIR